jgi:hypothetical protein
MSIFDVDQRARLAADRRAIFAAAPRQPWGELSGMAANAYRNGWRP